MKSFEKIKNCSIIDVYVVYKKITFTKRSVFNQVNAFKKNFVLEKILQIEN